MILKSPGVRSPGPYLPLACRVTPRKSPLIRVAESKLGAPDAWPAHSLLASVVSGALPGFLRQISLPPEARCWRCREPGSTACHGMLYKASPRSSLVQRTEMAPLLPAQAVSFCLRPSTQPSICGLELDCGAQLPGFMTPCSACKRVTNLHVCILACKKRTSLVPISEVYGER